MNPRHKAITKWILLTTLMLIVVTLCALAILPLFNSGQYIIWAVLYLLLIFVSIIYGSYLADKLFDEWHRRR